MACFGASKVGGHAAASFDLAGGDILCLRMTPTIVTDWQPLGDLETIKLGDATDPVPQRRYLKRVIRVGEYVKVADRQGRGGLQFAVTMNALANWVLQFSKMQQNGVKVGIPDGHDNEGKASENLGWVDRLWIDGGTLWMACTIIGEDAMRTVARADVSLGSPPRLTDGKGNQYVRPITHVAVCTDPVVPGLGSFIPLAASLRLQQGDVPMLEKLKKVAAALGLDPATIVNEVAGLEIVLDAVMAWLEKQTEEAGNEEPAAAGAPPGGAPPVAAGGGEGGVKKETLTREYAGKFGGAKAEPPNPLLVKSIAETRGLKIDALVLSGHLSPAAADKWREMFIGKDAEAVCLALSSGSDGRDFDLMIEATKLNDPIKTGVQSGPQTGIRLSDPNKTKPGEKSDLVKDAEARQAAAKK